MHGFNHVENRNRPYSQMPGFFDRHIGKQAQGVASANALLVPKRVASFGGLPFFIKTGR